VDVTPSSSLSIPTHHPEESPREAEPLFLYSSPSPLKERGIKGVR